jgi:four helix bundle protein
MAHVPGESAYLPIEQMEVFRRYVEIADWVWATVGQWQPLPRDTVGKQLVRAIDSVGANLVEGDGRRSDIDAAHFFVIARASAREARYWLERAVSRGLIPPEQGRLQMDALSGATQVLNRLISYRRGTARKDRIAEAPTIYDPTRSEPFAVE